MRESVDLDFFYLVGVELDAFLFQVVLNIPVTFVGIVPHPLGPSAGFLFYFEEGVDVGGEQLVGFAREVPHDDDAVAHGEQSVFFLWGGFVDVTHGMIAHLVTRFVAVRVTLGTSVPKTPVEFVHDVGVDVVPVHVEGFVALTNHVFPSIARVTNVTTVGVIQVSQPFQGCVGIRFALSMPSTDGFGGQLTRVLACVWCGRRDCVRMRW